MGVSSIILAFLVLDNCKVCFYVLDSLQRIMTFRFGFYTSPSGGQIIGNNCSNFGRHAWLITFLILVVTGLITSSW